MFKSAKKFLLCYDYRTSTLERKFHEKNLLQVPGSEPTTFGLMSSCLGVTFLAGICISWIDHFDFSVPSTLGNLVEVMKTHIGHDAYQLEKINSVMSKSFVKCICTHQISGSKCKFVKVKKIACWFTVWNDKKCHYIFHFYAFNTFRQHFLQISSSLNTR